MKLSVYEIGLFRITYSPYNIHGGINEDPRQDYIEHRVCQYNQLQLKKIVP